VQYFERVVGKRVSDRHGSNVNTNLCSNIWRHGWWRADSSKFWSKNLPHSCEKNCFVLASDGWNTDNNDRAGRTDLTHWYSCQQKRLQYQ